MQIWNNITTWEESDKETKQRQTPFFTHSISEELVFDMSSPSARRPFCLSSLSEFLQIWFNLRTLIPCLSSWSSTSWREAAKALNFRPRISCWASRCSRYSNLTKIASISFVFFFEATRCLKLGVLFLDGALSADPRGLAFGLIRACMGWKRSWCTCCSKRSNDESRTAMRISSFARWRRRSRMDCERAHSWERTQLKLSAIWLMLNLRRKSNPWVSS